MHDGSTSLPYLREGCDNHLQLERQVTLVWQNQGKNKFASHPHNMKFHVVLPDNIASSVDV